MARSFTTAADTAYTVIKDRILSGEYTPGQRLTRRAMAEATGVSIIPVIEALHRLEHDGLVESRPQWGSRVVELSEERVLDNFALREAVECQAARILAETHSTTQRIELRVMAEELDAGLYRNTDGVAQAELQGIHHRFHYLIAAHTGRKSLADALERINLFRLLQGVVERNRKRDDLPEDWHRRLVDAIATRDADEAEAAMRTHVRSSLDRIGAGLSVAKGETE